MIRRMAPSEPLSGMDAAAAGYAGIVQPGRL
jgi:hypothetical protein